MTKFNQLTNLNTYKKPKRKGRGISAGSGKTAGRGTKGQKARSGSKTKPFFEGGQTPLVRKLPKLAGFKSHRPKAINIYTYQLDEIKTTSKIIDNHILKQLGLVDNAFCKIKLIYKGSIKKTHEVHLQKASANAISSLEAAGGKFVVTAMPKRPTSAKKQGRSQAKVDKNLKKSK